MPTWTRIYPEAPDMRLDERNARSWKPAASARAKIRSIPRNGEARTSSCGLAEWVPRATRTCGIRGPRGAARRYVSVGARARGFYLPRRRRRCGPRAGALLECVTISPRQSRHEAEKKADINT